MASAPGAPQGGGYNRPVLGAIVGLAGRVGQGIFNMVQSRKNTRRTNRANMEMAQYQYDKDLEMWERNNAYNSPEAQMARLQKAGLNPNLVYGNGSVVGNTSGQMPQYNAPRQDYMGQLPPDISGLADELQRYQDYRLREAQIDNVKASTAATEFSALYTKQKTASELIDQAGSLTMNQKRLLELEIANELADTQVLTGEANLKLLQGKITLQDKQQTLAALDILYREMINIQQQEKNRNQPAHEVLDLAIKEMNWKQKEIVLELMKQGVNFNDPVWMRKLADILGGRTNYMEQWLEKIRTADID